MAESVTRVNLESTRSSWYSMRGVIRFARGAAMRGPSRGCRDSRVRGTRQDTSHLAHDPLHVVVHHHVVEFGRLGELPFRLGQAAGERFGRLGPSTLQTVAE